MKQQVIQGVQKAFAAAGDLVKDLTLVTISSTYDVTSAQNSTNEEEHLVKAITNEVDLRVIPASLIGKDLKEYLVMSDFDIQPSSKIIDDGKKYNIWKVLPISQNGTVFVYVVSIER